ncbi:unnamed protein product, partial [Closterium sp. NIES-53]
SNTSCLCVFALTAAVTEFATTRCLDYIISLVAAPPTIRCLDYVTSLVAAPPTSPLAVTGESALRCVALEDRQFELVFLAAASSHLCAMLLAPDGDTNALDIPTPRTYAEALLGPWASQWRVAMDLEIASYRSTGTYARYVARGFSQTFVPTPKMTTIRVLLHVAAQRDYELHSLDFSTAFLQGSLHEEVWLRRPSAFVGTFPLGTQWRLRQPPSSADPSLFVCRGSTLFFVLVYVDNLVFTTADRFALADMKRELQKRHTCTDLGLQITRDRAARTITLSQSHMVQQILQRFKLEHSIPSGPYTERVGCLMYLMGCSRPNLAFPLSILACFVAPGRHRLVDWTATVRVAKYLAMTSGVGLVLGGRQSFVFTGYCDSSDTDDAKTHRSTQGHGCAGAALVDFLAH